MKLSKIRRSRDRWKSKAMQRGAMIRMLRKVTRQQQRQLALISATMDETRRMKGESDPLTHHSTLTVLDQRDPQIHRRTLCVLMVIVGIVSFRSVPRILGVFLPFLMADLPLPHFTSVIHWTLRVGVAIFQQVASIRQAWIAILDCSIDVGTRKALVVLRVPLAALQNKSTALGLQDCQCIGLEVSHQWNGKLVSASLDKIFQRAGYPLAIIKDGGTDLHKGVELLQGKRPEHKIQVIEDIGHYTGNAIKAAFASTKPFARFLKIVSTGAARIRQTRLAWLRPPKIRSKGRFLAITAVAQWANKMLTFLARSGRAKDGSDLNAARKAFNGLTQLRPFLTQFCHICRLSEDLQKLMKTRGLNQSTYFEATHIIDQLPAKSIVKTRLSAWLEKHLRLHQALGIGDLRIPVSSDIIESLFGKFKTIIQRNPLCELNRLIYIIPLLCGNYTAVDIDRALNNCSHKEMLEYIEQTVPQTLRQLRNQESAKHSNMVPKSGIILNHESG